jgi:VWFA-related protein
MFRQWSVLLTIALALTVGFDVRAAGNAGDAAAQQPGDVKPAFGAEATAIVVDVIVRDKQGKPVTDLTAKDFELYEDDVRQEIGTLTLVAPGEAQGGAQSASSAAAETAASAGSTGPTFVALVFDRLSPEARTLAQKGATAYLETAQSADFAGVFVIDQALSTIQTYTNDREKLRAAIDTAASRASSPLQPGQGRPGSVAGGDTNPRTPVTAGAESQGRGAAQAQAPTAGPEGTATASADANRLAAMLAERMERSYDSMMRDQQGFATTSGLLALVDSLGTLPGRKTVVFFAEGIAIPPAVQAQFNSVVATANRANVSVYTIDAAGLRVHSQAAQTATQVGALAKAGIGDVARDPNQAYMRDLEQNEEILRDDPAVGLTMLAERTGGFMINNTNDLERGFRQIDADRRFHYLLTYTPKNSDFRGEFRRINVKVPARGVSVRARNGYVAVRATGGPILSHEGPVLALLDQSPLPSDLPARGGVFSFPDPKHPGQLALLVATEPAALTFQTDNKKKTFQTDFTILARVRSASGDVILKTSQPYRLNGPADQVDAAKRGEILFFRQPALGPGPYKLEYVVYDALGQKAGAGSEPFTVFDKPGQALQASSLLIVQRTERVPAAERTGDNPLYQGELLLYPNLGTPLRKSVDKTVSFAISVYAAGSPAPTATLVLQKDGTPLGQVPITLPAADASGRTQLASQLPLENFPPGTYTLELTIERGSEREVRTASFTLTE